MKFSIFCDIENKMAALLSILLSPLLLILTLLQSRSILSYFQKGGVRYFYNTKNVKDIALTIDDGPDNVTTPRILAVLKKHNVKATFFLIGNRTMYYPEIVRMILRDGHSIGNHDFYDNLSVWRPTLFPNNLRVTHSLINSCMREYKLELFDNASSPHDNGTNTEYLEEPRFFRPGCGFYAQW